MGQWLVSYSWDNHGVVELPLGGARGPHLFLQPRLDFVPVRFFFFSSCFHLSTNSPTHTRRSTRRCVRGEKCCDLSSGDPVRDHE